MGFAGGSGEFGHSKGTVEKGPRSAEEMDSVKNRAIFIGSSGALHHCCGVFEVLVWSKS